MAFKDIQYAPVGDDDEELQEKGLPPLPQRRQKTAYGLLLISIVASIISGIVLGSIWPLKLPSHSKIPTAPVVTDCGRTSADAISRGCVMEPLIYGWMPPHCRYPEVTNNYSFDKWTWFADENLTIPLSSEDLWQGRELKIWTGEAGYHTEHCLFLWEKNAYAQKNGLPWLDRKSLSFEHARHCIEQLKDLGEGEDPLTVATLGIYECDPTPWTT